MHVCPNYYKKFHNYIKTNFVLSNIRMINVSLNKLKLIAQSRKTKTTMKTNLKRNW